MQYVVDHQLMSPDLFYFPLTFAVCERKCSWCEKAFNALPTSSFPPQKTNIPSQGRAHGGGQGLIAGPLIRPCGDEETQLSDSRHGHTHTHTHQMDTHTHVHI